MEVEEKEIVEQYKEGLKRSFQRKIYGNQRIVIDLLIYADAFSDKTAKDIKELVAIKENSVKLKKRKIRNSLENLLEKGLVKKINSNLNEENEEKYKYYFSLETE